MTTPADELRTAGDRQAEPPIGPMTIADLTDRHVGWEINVDDPSMMTAVRSIWLLAVARTDQRDGSGIELHDGLCNPGRVTLFRYPPETPCKVTRRFPQARRSRRRATRSRRTAP